MAKDSEKILGMAINSLVRTNSIDEVNDLVKSCLEMSKVSVDGAFGYLEDDVRPNVGNVLNRSTMIDIMKSVEHIEDVSTIEKVCGDSDSFVKARNFMKMSNPKFFDDSRARQREEERGYLEKVKMITAMKDKYTEALKKKEDIIKSMYNYDDYVKDEDEHLPSDDIWEAYRKYSNKNSGKY